MVTCPVLEAMAIEVTGVAEEESVELQLGGPGWSDFGPARGQIIEVLLSGGDFGLVADVWAPFLILQVALLPDNGGLELEPRRRQCRRRPGLVPRFQSSKRNPSSMCGGALSSDAVGALPCDPIDLVERRFVNLHRRISIWKETGGEVAKQGRAGFGRARPGSWTSSSFAKVSAREIKSFRPGWEETRARKRKEEGTKSRRVGKRDSWRKERGTHEKAERVEVPPEGAIGEREGWITRRSIHTQLRRRRGVTVCTGRLGHGDKFGPIWDQSSEREGEEPQGSVEEGQGGPTRGYKRFFFEEISESIGGSSSSCREDVCRREKEKCFDELEAGVITSQDPYQGTSTWELKEEKEKGKEKEKEKEEKEGRRFRWRRRRWRFIQLPIEQWDDERLREELQKFGGKQEQRRRNGSSTEKEIKEKPWKCAGVAGGPREGTIGPKRLRRGRKRGEGLLDLGYQADDVLPGPAETKDKWIPGSDEGDASFGYSHRLVASGPAGGVRRHPSSPLSMPTPEHIGWRMGSSQTPGDLPHGRGQCGLGCTHAPHPQACSIGSSSSGFGCRLWLGNLWPWSQRKRQARMARRRLSRTKGQRQERWQRPGEKRERLLGEQPSWKRRSGVEGEQRIKRRQVEVEQKRGLVEATIAAEWNFTEDEFLHPEPSWLRFLSGCSNIRATGCVLCWVLVTGSFYRGDDPQLLTFFNQLAPRLTAGSWASRARAAPGVFPLREGELVKVRTAMSFIEFKEVIDPGFVREWSPLGLCIGIWAEFSVRFGGRSSAGPLD